MLFNHNIYTNGLSGKATLMVALLAGLLVSCVQIEEKEQEICAAYISFSSIDIDYDVDGMILTKASVPADDLPEAGDFTVRISGEGIEDIVYAPGNIPSESVIVKAGTYNIEASCGSNSFDGPFFYKSVSIEVEASQTKTVSLENIPLANAMVALVLPEGISQHLDLNSLQISDGVTSVDVTPGQYVYVPSGVAITAEFAGVNSLGVSKQISYPLGVLEGQHAYTVICDLSLPAVNITLPDQQDGAWATRLYVTPAMVISDIPTDKLVYEAIEASSSDWNSAKKSEVIDGAYHVIKGLTNGTSYKVRARIGAFVSNEKTVIVKEQLDAASFSASHVYESNYLTGSTATADLGIKDGSILKTLYDAGLLIVSGGALKYGSVSVRSISALSGTMSVAGGWPYLPQGSGYTFEVYHKLQGESSEIVSTISGITVPAPQFTVSASAYTSYNKYLDRDLTFANEPNNKHIVFERKAGVTISNELLSNANYSKSSSITFDGSQIGTFDSNSKSFGNATNCTTWKNYPLVANMTFDGVSKSSTKDCHITGLPYQVSPPTSSDWSKSGTVNFRSGDVRFGNGGGAGSISMNNLHVPSDIYVAVSAKIDAYGAPVNTTTYIDVGGVRLFECTSNSSAFSYKTVTLETTKNGTLLSSNKSVVAGTTYGLGTTRGHIYYINILYR